MEENSKKIKFKALNSDGNECSYEYKDRAELKSIWRSDNIDMDVPANDDPVFDIEIDGQHPLADVATREKTETDPFWFEDLLTYLGIEIWG